MLKLKRGWLTQDGYVKIQIYIHFENKPLKAELFSF